MASASGSDDSGSPAQRRSTTTSRRKKSTSQLSRLEEMYSEDKYPSEEARAKLSEELGLSEKQMQIWFTHRRHKDRKDGVADERLTFYSMRHKGGEAHLDFMEELSTGKQRMVAGSSVGKNEISPDRGFPPARPYSGGFSVQNSQQSSGRSTDSDSDNSGHGQVKDLQKPTGSKVSLKRPSSAVHPHKVALKKKPMTLLPPKPKAQTAKDIERAAIAAVETQLGESVRADGPRVGLVFDSIPQGAWTRLTNLEGPMMPTTAPAPAPLPVPVYGGHPMVIQGRLVSGMEGRSPSDMQGRLPSNMQGRLPIGVQGRLPSALQGRVPLDMPGRFPSDMKGRFPSPMQGRVPLDMQGRLPSDMQGRLPSDMQGRLPSDMQGRSSMGMQGRFPLGMEGRLPMGMQERLPLGMEGRLPMGMQERLPMGMQERLPMVMQERLPLGRQSVGAY